MCPRASLYASNAALLANSARQSRQAKYDRTGPAAKAVDPSVNVRPRRMPYGTPVAVTPFVARHGDEPPARAVDPVGPMPSRSER